MDQIKHLLEPIASDFFSTPGKNLIFSHYNDSDHHTILATSTDVEWAFLHGGLTVFKMCHTLSDESTRAAIVLSSWCDFLPAIPCDEIIATFRDKIKRPKGKE